MLYILGGAARCGKSTVSRKLLEEKRVPYLPVDIFITPLRKGAPELGIIHEMPTMEKAEKLWKFIKPLAEHLLKREPNYLLEGDGLLPKHVSELISENPGKVIACFTGYPKINTKVKFNLIRKYEEEGDWTSYLSEQKLTEAVESSKKLSIYLYEECGRYNIPFFDGSEDFNKNVKNILNYFLKQ